MTERIVRTQVWEKEGNDTKLVEETALVNGESYAGLDEAIAALSEAADIDSTKKVRAKRTL